MKKIKERRISGKKEKNQNFCRNYPRYKNAVLPGGVFLKEMDFAGDFPKSTAAR